MDVGSISNGQRRPELISSRETGGPTPHPSEAQHVTGLRYSSESDKNPAGPLCCIWYSIQVREEENRGELCVAHSVHGLQSENHGLSGNLQNEIGPEGPVEG